MFIEIINIDSNLLELFSLPLTKPVKDQNIEIVINEIVDDLHKISIELEAFYSVQQHKEKIKVSYNKDNLTCYQDLFIGWSYLVKYNTSSKRKEDFLEKAKEYLLSSIYKKIESCLPHYLLAEFPINYIEGPNSINRLYYAINNYKDDFPDLYSLLYRVDKNKIRAIGILKKGLEKFPGSFILAYHYSNFLIEKKDYESALKVLQNVKTSEFGKYGFKFYYDFIYNIFNCLINLDKYTEAEKIIDSYSDYIEEFELDFLRGILCYHKNELDKAIKHFINCIQKDYRESIAYASHFFLLDCYLKKGNRDGIEEIIKLIPEYIVDYFTFSFEILYLDIAERCYREIINLEKIDELIKSKTKGLLASLILYNKLPDFIYQNQRRKLTDNETKLFYEAKTLIKSALDFHPYNVFFLSTYSDVLYYEEKYDEALIAKLEFLKKAIHIKDLEVYPTVSLNDCSEEFLSNYANKLDKFFSNDEEFKNFYVRELLPDDIEILFKIKEYNSIVNLFFLLKSELNAIEDFHLLFKIAYSLKELDYVEEAKFLYEKLVEINDKDSSVYNNLAIIYEEKKDMENAIKHIKKAKKLNSTDLIIEKNYQRIINKESSKKTSKYVSKKENKLIFDPKSSKIIYGDKFCEIPINTYEYYLCKAIFEKPFGTKIQEEDIAEILDRVKLDEKRRTIYDTCIRINKKVERNIGLRKIIAYKASMLWIREDIN